MLLLCWAALKSHQSYKLFNNTDDITYLVAEGFRKNDMFYLTTHSAHFIYGYMVSDIGKPAALLRGLLFSISRKGSYRQDRTYHGFCHTRRDTLTGTRNSSMVVLERQHGVVLMLLSILIISF